MVSEIRTLIKGGKIVNEGKVSRQDILIEGEFIKAIDKDIEISENVRLIKADGKYVLPGLIDDQVHFREPGFIHKADIFTESRAAIAGGITSFIEMPNTFPQTTTLDLLEEKFKIAEEKSCANFSFMLGGTYDNLDALSKVDPKKVAGIKLFLGSSTGNMLVDDITVLEKIFSSSNLLISVHCEEEQLIMDNLKKSIAKYGQDIPIEQHPWIRSALACYSSTSKAIELAKKTGARLHVFHLSTAIEMDLFRNDIPLNEKKITSEVCVHHLSFDDRDYREKGVFIKWNPAIKTARDREALWKALIDDRIDVIATDHAPHTLEEKRQPYTKSPSGGPLVQHALPVMLNFVDQGKLEIEKLVEKMCHNPAIIFEIQNRGFIKKDYYADLVLIQPGKPWTVSKENILYKCGWSPFEGWSLSNTVTHTFVNGNLVYRNGQFDQKVRGKRLIFNR